MSGDREGGRPPAERVALLLAVALICWLVMVLVRVENQRYALSLGMCAGDQQLRMPDFQCLQNVETRTAWWWHVYWAAREFGAI